ATSLLFAFQDNQASVVQAPAPSTTIQLSVQALDAKGEVPRPLQAGDLTVIEDDQPHPATALTPLPGPWRIVIYVDRILTGSAAPPPPGRRRRRRAPAGGRPG